MGTRALIIFIGYLFIGHDLFLNLTIIFLISTGDSTVGRKLYFLGCYYYHEKFMLRKKVCR